MLKNVRSIAGAYAYCEEMIRRGKPDGAFKSLILFLLISRCYSLGQVEADGPSF